MKRSSSLPRPQRPNSRSINQPSSPLAASGRTGAGAGCGRIAPDAVPEILAAHDRARAGQGAPACGLCLEWLKYGDDRADGEGGRE